VLLKAGRNCAPTISSYGVGVFVAVFVTVAVLVLVLVAVAVAVAVFVAVPVLVVVAVMVTVAVAVTVIVPVCVAVAVALQAGPIASKEKAAISCWAALCRYNANPYFVAAVKVWSISVSTSMPFT
jgi:hypothetical protein